MATGKPPAFGALLRHYREAAGLTQEALAERAGLSTRAITALERGVNRAPRRDTLQLLGTALGLSAQERALFAAAIGRPRGLGSPDQGPVALTGGVGASVPGQRAERSAPPLVGRAAELALLERHLDGSGPPVLLLAGEPGIGKTRLLQEAARRGAEHGLRVLAGGCQGHSGQDPFAPLLEALEAHIRSHSPLELRAELQGCAWLVRLLPELAEGPIQPLPAWTLSPAQERRLMFAAVVRFLRNLAQQGSQTTGVRVLLVLDDLQWAGPDACDLLAELARCSDEVGLRILGAYRDTDVGRDDPLSLILGRLAHAAVATAHPLGPLTVQEARALLAALLAGGAGGTPEEEDARLRAQVLQRAGGVPFFLVSCAHELQVRSAVELTRAERPRLDGRSMDGVPWTLAQGLRQRIAALPVAARELLGVAAVVGRAMPHAVLAAVAGLPEADLLIAVEAACRARLLEEAGEADYRFAHDVIREVVDAELSAARRRLLHRDIAQVLEGLPGEPQVEALAYHYGQAEDHARAAQWLERAGDHAAAGYAHSEALERYAAARQHLQRSGADAGPLSRLDETLGDLHALLGAYAQAQEEFARARSAQAASGRRAQLWHKEGVMWEKQGDLPRALLAFDAAEQEGAESGTALSPSVRAEVELGRATVFYDRTEYESAEAALARASALVDGESPGGATTRLLISAAWLQGLVANGRGDFVEQEGCAQRMIALAESVGDQQGMGRAWFALGVATVRQGYLARAEECFRRGLALLERLGDQEFIAASWWGRGNVAEGSGDLAQAEECYRRYVVLCERSGHRGILGLGPALVNLGRVLTLRGNLAQAEDCCRRSLAIAERIGEQEGIANAWIQLGRLARERGDLTAADRWCRLARRLARRTGSRDVEVSATVDEARARLRARHLGAATSLLAHGRTLIAKDGQGERAMELALLSAELHLWQGTLGEAQTAAAEMLRLATDAGQPARVAQAQCLLGQCALAQGVPNEAVAHLRSALALQDAIGVALDAARTRRALAEALVAQTGRVHAPGEARALLAEAQAQFAASGAGVDLAEAEHLAAVWAARSLTGGR